MRGELNYEERRQKEFDWLYQNRIFLFLEIVVQKYLNIENKIAKKLKL